MRALRRVPIRIKVTLAFALVMAVVLAGVGLFLYVRLGDQLDESIDLGIGARASEFSALIESSSGTPTLAADAGTIDLDESFAQILTPDGEVVASTPQLDDTALLDAAELSSAADGPTMAGRDSLTGVDGAVRLLALPVDAPDGPLVAIVGASLEDREEALSNLATLLLIGGPIALLLASLAGYGATAAALRPVEAMRRRAGEISASGPDERLPVPAAKDELSRLGETLNAMLARLEQTLERERRFVDDASHELRTPLALHRVELELALRQASSEGELREAITSAMEEIDRLITLAEDLLVVARSEHADAAARHDRLEVAELLTATAERFNGVAERAGRSVVADPNSAGEQIEADRLRVEQALANVVDNSLRHGGGRVRLWSRVDQERVELHVSDEGAGFPPEFLEHAFERFSRADASRGRGGAGLGLAIVDAVARAHGGSAHARNVECGGADVWLVLPQTGA